LIEQDVRGEDMPTSLSVLILEDRPSDAELMVHALRRGGLTPNWKRVDSEEDFLKEIETIPDLILADYCLPQFDALRALLRLQERKLDIPFIVVTGSISEEVAVACMKQGAADYLIKDRMTRLGQAVTRALEEKSLRQKMKNAEEALRRSEALNRSVLSSLVAMIAVINAEGDILMTNEAWERSSRARGVTDPHVASVGSNYFAVCQNAAQAGDRVAQEALDGVKSVSRGEIPLFTQEYLCPTPEGATWYSMMASPLIDQPGGVVISHTEITERKEIEGRMHLQAAALEAAANAILIEDRDLNIVWANPAFSRLTGFSIDDAVGQGPDIFRSMYRDDHQRQEIFSTIRGGEVWQGELVNKRKDGSLYVEEMTVTPVPDGTGEINHFIEIKQDITETRQRQHEMEAIVSVANALRTANTRSAICPILLDQVSDLLHATGCSVSLLNASTNDLIVQMALGEYISTTGKREKLNGGLNGHIFETKQPYRCCDMCGDERVFGADVTVGSTAVVGVPLITEDQVIGILWLGRSEPFTDHEVQVLTGISDIAASALHRASLLEETELRLKRLTILREIDKAITASLDVRVTLSVLVDQITNQLGMDAAEVLLFNPQTQILETAARHGFQQVYGANTAPLGQNHVRRAAIERRTISLPDLSASSTDLRQRLLGRGEDFNAYFAVPLIAKGQVKGVLEIFNRQAFQPERDWLSFLEMLAGQAAIAIDNAELFDNLQRSNTNLSLAYDDTIEGWSRALDLRDKETEGHTLRVTDMTVRLAQAAGLNERDIMHARWGALLHDIGKMGIPDCILLKPGTLNEEEWEVIRRHPSYAFELLSPITFLNPAIDIPYCHHEHWDGTGYPRGLKNEQIPLSARIFSIADVYDALISNRPYRAGWPAERVREYIRHQAGLQFDPALVNLFLGGTW
jgi:PAS domain S-box-containing protein